MTALPTSRISELLCLQNEQRGFSLVIVLVFMLVLVMLGITGMQAAGLQERMAGHNRDRTVAFQAAESALRTAERAAMFTSWFDYDPACASALCAAGTAPDPFTYAWNDAQSVAIDRTVAANQLSPDLAANPRYYIEFAGTIALPGGKGFGQEAFRITTRAVGQNAQSAVMLQSFVRK